LEAKNKVEGSFYVTMHIVKCLLLKQRLLDRQTGKIAPEEVKLHLIKVFFRGGEGAPWLPAGAFHASQMWK